LEEEVGLLNILDRIYEIGAPHVQQLSSSSSRMRGSNLFASLEELIQNIRTVPTIHKITFLEGSGRFGINLSTFIANANRQYGIVHTA
jgi:hypothetical protein